MAQETLKYIVSLKDARGIVEASSNAEATKIARNKWNERFVRVLGLMNGIGK